MTVPRSVRQSLKEHLSIVAESIDWETLGQKDKARHYELWTRDPQIGGILDRYMDRGQIRVYIKDSLLKDFSRTRQANPTLPLRAAGIDTNERFDCKYIKPHGRRTSDGRVICWGRADDWKVILMAAYERAYVTRGSPEAVILTGAVGRFMDQQVRQLIEEAAKKLGVGKIAWLN
jgi:hypothetical protein